MDYFQVRLGSLARIGIPLSHVMQVMVQPYREICPIPGMMEGCLGVVNQQGRLLWVADLRRLLGIPLAGDITQQRLTLVVLTLPRDPQPKLACVVDRLEGIVNLDPDQIQPTPSRLARAIQPFLSGMAQVEGSPLALLQPEQVFGSLRTRPLVSGVY